MKESQLPLVVGNWKMNMDEREIKNFFQQLSIRFPQGKSPSFGLAPQFIHIPMVMALAQEMNFPLRLGAQNCGHQSDFGAFTGEVSPRSLSDLGVDFVIVGHSERRQYFNETSELLKNKIKAAWECGHMVILCVGETLEQRNLGQTKEVVKTQLKEIFQEKDIVIPGHPYPLVVAYEPVWAIGTGRTPTPQEAEDTHTFIRSILTEIFPHHSDIPLLYGGSINSQNVRALLAMNDIDGVLVGGASTKVEEWGKILHLIWEN